MPVAPVTPVASVAPDAPVAPVAPVAEHPAADAVAGPVTAGTERRWGTVWVWLLAFAPWLWALTGFFAIHNTPPVGASTWEALLPASAPFALTVLFAVLDVRQLREWHGKAAHWAWALLGAPAYIVARTVVLRRRGRFGTAPLWVVLVNTAAAFVPFIPLAVLFFVLAIMGLHSSFSGN
jgi:hypothetical protein